MWTDTCHNARIFLECFGLLLAEGFAVVLRRVGYACLEAHSFRVENIFGVKAFLNSLQEA